MSGLFINYRRDDTAPYAGRIYDFLHRSFPETKVFMDIDAIDPGEDFVDAINRTLAASKVVIAVVGPNWMRVADKDGARRIDNPDDYVARELCAALESGARVIPVLVGGATMPRSDSLPPRLQPLARRHAIEIRDTRFIADAEQLKAAIRRVIDPENKNQSPAEPVLDRATALSGSFDDAMTTFKTLLWTSYALGIVSLFFQFGRGTVTAGTVVFDAILLGLVAWLNISLIRGKNWARMAYVSLLIATTPFVLYEWAEQSGVEVALNLVSIALSIWLLRMMFTAPIKAKFVYQQ